MTRVENPVVVIKVDSYRDRDHAFRIRREVFINEQGVSEEEEFDEFDNVSVHFLARFNDVPAGTARWRLTGEGVKLERFCTLKKYRGKGVGTELVLSVLDDVLSTVEGKQIYIHAQVEVIPFYKSFGFRSLGQPFDECGIMHQVMQLHK